LFVATNVAPLRAGGKFFLDPIPWEERNTRLAERIVGPGQSSSSASYRFSEVTGLADAYRQFSIDIVEAPR